MDGYKVVYRSLKIYLYIPNGFQLYQKTKIVISIENNNKISGPIKGQKFLPREEALEFSRRFHNTE
jgi:hypothetical protein